MTVLRQVEGAQERIGRAALAERDPLLEDFIPLLARLCPETEKNKDQDDDNRPEESNPI
jgi:hypothetical protein